MAKHKYIESPEKMWELPLKKYANGIYMVIPPKRNYSGITLSNKNKNPNGFIYFIKANGHDYYKIGVSSNVRRRLNDIDSYMPFDMQILSLHWLNNVYEVEGEIHKSISKFKIRREWYQLTIDKAKEIMIELHNINVKQDASTV